MNPSVSRSPWPTDKGRLCRLRSGVGPISGANTGEPAGPNFVAVPRNSAGIVPTNFGAPRSGLEIPECSSVRIYTRIPWSLPVISPVIGASDARGYAFEQIKPGPEIMTVAEYAESLGLPYTGP